MAARISSTYDTAAIRIRAAYYTEALPEPATDREAVVGVMAVARNVSVPFGTPYKTPGTVHTTEYRTVCDLTNLRYSLELTTSPSVVWVDLSQLDLTPGSPPMVLDPHDDELAGDVTSAFLTLDPRAALTPHRCSTLGPPGCPSEILSPATA